MIEDGFAGFKYSFTPGVRETSSRLVKKQSLFNSFVEERKAYQLDPLSYQWSEEQQSDLQLTIFCPPPPELDGATSKEQEAILKRWATTLHYYLWKKGNNPGRFSWGRWLQDYNNDLSCENYPTHWKRCEPKNMPMPMLKELLRDRESYGPVIDKTLVPKSKKRKRKTTEEDSVPGFVGEFAPAPPDWPEDLNLTSTSRKRAALPSETVLPYDSAQFNDAWLDAAADRGSVGQGDPALAQPSFSFPSHQHSLSQSTQVHPTLLNDTPPNSNPTSPLFGEPQLSQPSPPRSPLFLASEFTEDPDLSSFSVEGIQYASYPQVSADILALSRSIFQGFLEIDDTQQSLQKGSQPSASTLQHTVEPRTISQLSAIEALSSLPSYQPSLSLRPTAQDSEANTEGDTRTLPSILAPRPLRRPHSINDMLNGTGF